MKFKDLQRSVKKLAGVILIGAVVLSSLSACGSSSTGGTSIANSEQSSSLQTSSETTDDKTKELVPLRIGVGGQDDTPIMELGTLAYKNGYFEEELNAVGYTFKPTIFAQTGPEVNEALASGNLDGAIYGDLPAFTSKSKGIDTTIVALVNPKTQYSILTVSDDIQKPKDLEGKKVIVMQGTVMQYFWEQYAVANDIDTSKIEIINSVDTASLLQTGQADAYVALTYVTNYMQSIGIGKVFDNGEDVKLGSTTGVVTLKSDLLKEHEELAVALNKALIRAYNDATSDPDSFYKSIETPKMSADIMKTEYEFDPSLSYLNPQITDETIKYYEKFNDWLVDHSIISEKVDVNTFVDTSYYSQAVEEIK